MGGREGGVEGLEGGVIDRWDDERGKGTKEERNKEI